MRSVWAIRHDRKLAKVEHPIVRRDPASGLGRDG